jgi:hypothetical protein
MPKGIPGSRPTCGWDGCDELHAARGFCDRHVKVAYRRGIISVLEPEPRFCKEDGCGKPYYCRDYCHLHYNRLQRTGTTAAPYQTKRRCEQPGCENEHEAKGMCRMHYRRWQLHGDPTVVIQPPRHGLYSGRNWKGDGASYANAHQRLKRRRGRPSAHACQKCGRPAEDWAYDHLDPDERQDPKGPYSLDPAYYMPLCRVCHRRFDLPFRRSKGA